MDFWTTDFGLYNVDTTIKYGYSDESQTIVTHDRVLVFPVWLILLIILGVVIYIVRKKELSPIKIKIELKK